LKSLTMLWQQVAYDYATRCCTSATKDIKTVLGRTKHEGLSFLTITLPSFGKDFQKSLDQGIVGYGTFTAFKTRGRSSRLPAFLQGFSSLVFDPESSVLLDDPDVDAILAIRQLTLMFSKILLPCSESRVAGAMSTFIECEQDVRRDSSNLKDIDLSDFRRVSSLLFANVFSEMDREIYNEKLIPKHGPGATADKLRGNAKFNSRSWTSRLNRYFPFEDYLFPSCSYYDHFGEVNILEPGSEVPVKVTPVPKTLKSPRIIAVEPTAMQYAQQAVLALFLECFGRDRLLPHLLGFDDQVPNQELARLGSLSTGNLATLDLSDASDRVSNQLVREMLARWPHLHGAVDACRSRKADVPGHGVVRLAKFASMGSALCFPFEAMVFLTIVLIGWERASNTHVSRSSLFEMIGSMRIYGDDIIIPADIVHSVVETLELFGARVGSGKSFWTGRFRESCGKEYYDGHDVSIVKVRRVFPSTRKHVPEVISLVSLRNQLYKAGCWRAVKWLDSEISRIIVHYPYVSDSSPCLGRFSFLGYETQREHRSLHSPLVKGYVVSPRIPSDPLDGPGALLKYFLKRGSQPFADRRHLERAGRPHAVDIKLRWCSPF